MKRFLILGLLPASVAIAAGMVASNPVQIYDKNGHAFTGTDLGGGKFGLDTTASFSGTIGTVGQGAPGVAAWPVSITSYPPLPAGSNTIGAVKVTDGTNNAAIKPALTAPLNSDPSLVVAISPNSPISVTSVPPADTNVVGTITTACPTGSGCAASSYVKVLTSGFSTMGYETHGTWSGTLTTDVSFDAACSTSPAAVLWLQTASVDTTQNEAAYLTTFTEVDNNDSWVLNTSGVQCARVRAVSLNSGTVNVTLDAGVGTSTVWSISVGNVTAGLPDAGNPIKAGGVYHSALPVFADGTRTDLQTDTNGRLLIGSLPAGSNTIGSINNISGTVSLPTGAATSAKQDTGNASLASIDGKITTTVNGIKVDGSAVSQPVTQATAANLNAQVQGNVASGAVDSGNPVKSGLAFHATQPTVIDGERVDAQGTARGAAIVATGVDAFNINNVSGTVSLPTGAATSANQTNGSQKTQVIDAGGNVAPAGDTAGRSSFVRVTDATNTAAVKAASTAAVATDPALVVAVSPNNSVAVTQATAANLNSTVTQGPAAGIVGAWPVKPTDGTNSQSYTASGEAKVLVTPLTNSSIVKAQIQDNAGNGITSEASGGNRSAHVALSQGGNTAAVTASNALKVDNSAVTQPVGGVFNTVLPALTNGQSSVLQLDSSGRLITARAPTTTTGTITTTQSVTLNAATHSVSAIVTGTWTGTLVFEESGDGVNYISAEAFVPNAAGSENTVTSTTVNGTFIFAQTAGMISFRVRGNSVATGTASIQLTSTEGSFNGVLTARENGNSVPTYGQMNGVSDGTNLRFMAGDSSGRVLTSDNSLYANITTAATTTVKSGAGVLFAICYNTQVNNSTVTIYDNTTAAAPTIGKITETLGGGADAPSGCYRYGGMAFNTGLTVVTSAAVDITVLYR